MSRGQAEFLAIAVALASHTACSDTPEGKSPSDAGATQADSNSNSTSSDAAAPGSCPVVHESFDGDALDANIWRVWESRGWTLQTGDTLDFVPEEIQNTRNAVITAQTPFDLSGCATSMEVIRTLPEDIRGEVVWSVEVTTETETRVIFTQSANQLAFVVVDDGAITQSNATYEPNEHRWWRVRDDAGTIVAETSPDSEAWTVQAEHQHDWDLSASSFSLAVRTTAITELFDGPQFDNVYLPTNY